MKAPSFDRAANAVVACITLAGATITAAALQPAAALHAQSSLEGAPFAVFVTLPTIDGFADATHALREAQEHVRQAIQGGTEMRLVGRPEEADVVLMILKRGHGAVELTPALRALDRSVITPAVALGDRETFIEAMLIVGPCGNVPPVTRTGPPPPASCYRKVFVGTGFGYYDARNVRKKPVPGSWEACADGIAKDLRAWLTENASRVRALRRAL
jgi:hypothetical protein